jgi:hypothetical protein
LDFCLSPFLFIDQTFELELFCIMEVWQELFLLILEDTQKAHSLECKISPETISYYFHKLLELAELTRGSDTFGFLNALEILFKFFHEKNLQLLLDFNQLILNAG